MVSGAETGGGGGGGGGDGGVYIPPIIGPHPPQKLQNASPPNILNLPNLLNGDHLVLSY